MRPIFFQLHPNQDYIVGVGEKYKLVNHICCLDIELLSSKLNKLCVFGRTIMQRQRCQQDTIKL